MGDDDELVRRVAESLAISPDEAERVVGDVVAYYFEPVDEFVRRRHARCQRSGMANAEIYPMIADELDARVFAAPELSERQIRRIIYG